MVCRFQLYPLLWWRKRRLQQQAPNLRIHMVPLNADYERQLDEGEFLDVFTATQQELEDWMRDGLLTDAKTVVGMMWLLQWRAGRWPLQWQTV